MTRNTTNWTKQYHVCLLEPERKYLDALQNAVESQTGYKVPKKDIVVKLIKEKLTQLGHNPSGMLYSLVMMTRSSQVIDT